MQIGNELYRKMKPKRNLQFQEVIERKQFEVTYA